MGCQYGNQWQCGPPPVLCEATLMLKSMLMPMVHAATRNHVGVCGPCYPGEHAEVHHQSFHKRLCWFYCLYVAVIMDKKASFCSGINYWRPVIENKRHWKLPWQFHSPPIETVQTGSHWRESLKRVLKNYDKELKCSSSQVVASCRGQGRTQLSLTG